MNRDQVLGRLHKAGARVKELAGMLLGHRALISRARAEFAIGRAQAEFGDARLAVEQRRLAMKRGRAGYSRYLRPEGDAK